MPPPAQQTVHERAQRDQIQVARGQLALLRRRPKPAAPCRTGGVGACFCPENLARLLLAAQPHDRLEMLRMPDTMAHPISFGYAKRACPWSVLADFIRIARAQSPQPA